MEGPRFIRLLARRVFGCSVLVLLACWTSFVHAAAPITPSGLNTKISDPFLTAGGKTQYDITGGTRPGGGLNLFHSFGDFNVPTNNIANFLNDSGFPTSNILGRVTGGNPSSIFGMIQTTGFGNANLFLMNPYGFLFGPNATLNVGGMVAFTTANYLRFQGTETVFDSASTPQSLSLLTSAPVAAFGFLGGDPSAIAIQGSTLKVADGQSLSLVGGNKGFTATDPDNGQAIEVPGGITMTGGKLLAPGGRINIATVGGAGEISAVEFLPTPGMTMGNIGLSQGALLDVSADAAGTVRIRGGQLVMDNATISADTVNANGAPIAIDLNLTGDLSISSNSVAALTARTTGVGDSGEIRISGQNVNMAATGPEFFTPFAVIDTHTSGLGKAGDVTIAATNNVTLSGDPGSFVWAINGGTLGPDGGHGGNVTLNAKKVDIQYAQIDTGTFFAVSTFDDAASGSGGNLTITADSVNLTNSFLVTDGFFGGRGGNLTISAHDVQMSQFSALSTSGTIKSGTIQITADLLKVSESQFESNTGAENGGGIIFTGKVGEFTNGSTIQSSAFGPGDAGPITFTATERLTFSDPTDLDVAPIRPSGLFTTSFRGPGNGGTINVNTPLLELTGGARFDATTRTNANGGNINILANVVSVSGERPLEIFEGPIFGLATSLASGIYSRTVQSRNCIGPCGNAGPISITTGSLSLNQGGRIDSSSGSPGRGGDITINANQVSIDGTMTDGTAGGIFTTAANTGAGGNIILNANSMVLQNGGTLSASTSGTEPSAVGGTIAIAATDVHLRNGALITAQTTGASNAGAITITAHDSVSLEGGSAITSTSFFNTNGNGGPVSITAPTVSLQDSSIVTFVVGFGSETSTAGAGDVTINASKSVSLAGGTIDSSIFDTAGNAGHISITSPIVSLSKASTISSAASNSGFNPDGTPTGLPTDGNGGLVELAVGQLVLAGGSQITTQNSGGGLGGGVTVHGEGGAGTTAADVTITSGSGILTNATDLGPAGHITVDTARLTLSDGGQMQAATLSAGAGGTITIHATEQATISGEALICPSCSQGNRTMASQINTSSAGVGRAGDILIQTPSLSLTDGGRIVASTIGGGTGGTVTVQGPQGAGSMANSFLASGRSSEGAISGIFTDTQATGAGGNIFVNANIVTLSNGGTLSAKTSGTEASATGGTITIEGREVLLTNQATIIASAETIFPSNSGNAGNITVAADQSITLLGNSSISSTTSNAGNGGSIQLTAPNIELQGQSNIGVDTAGVGRAGDILFQVNHLNLANDSRITARTQSEGDAGDITIRGLRGEGSKASDVILSGSQLVSETIGDGINSQGNAGNILIETAQLTLNDASQLNTASRGSTGSAGHITIHASDRVTISSSEIISGSLEAATGDGGQIAITSPNVVVENNGTVSTSTEFTGQAGNISINTNSLQITSGGQITSNSRNVVMEFLSEFPEFTEFFPVTGPAGKAGTVTIQGLASAAESVVITGAGSGIFTETRAEGAGGNIFMNANAVTLQNGGMLSAATLGTAPTATGGTITIDANQVQVSSGGLITASTSGAGAGGSVNINAGSTFASNAGTVSSTASQAAGGDITISAGQSVTLENGSLITASSKGEGNAGNIVINAGQFYTSTNSSVTTKADHASGGNITVLASGMVHLTNSEINASVEGSKETVGGNILIDPVYVILENSKILAQATQGQGGNINIFYTGALLADPSSIIDASSQFGQSGTVTIQSPISPASGKIIPLSQKPLIASALLSQRCAAVADGRSSSFTVVGRDTLPAEPSGWLSSPLALSGEGLPGSSGVSSLPGSNNEPNQTNRILSLRRIAPPGFLTQNFAVDSGGCTS